MSEGSIFEKPTTEALRLIERLSTEFEVCLILLSAVLAADVSLYFYKKQNILMFNWKFGDEINIGAILTFFLLFSLMMTFVSGLIIVALKFFWLLLPYKVTSLIDYNKNYNYAREGYELDFQLERYALSEKDTFLMDLVRQHRERKGKIERNTRNLAQLAVSVVVLIGWDWRVGQADRGTFAQIVWTYADKNILAVVILCLFGLSLIVAIKDELAYNEGEDWVLYPPGVNGADNAKAKVAPQRD